MSIEDEVASVVSRWNDGELAAGELWSLTVDLMTSPTNVDMVVRGLPEGLRTDFIEDLVQSAQGESQLIRGSVCKSWTTPEEDAASEREWALKNERWAKVVQPAIREWVRSRG